jgi:DNA adenine methylase
MSNLLPVLKWAGGKRWLAAQYQSIFPTGYDRLVEPFAGSAAVFFSFMPGHAWLNDVNVELINTYQAISNDWESVLKALRQHQKNHSTEYYYEVRESKPRLEKSRAAKFIYLNRTCFNGLYRVNLKGKFNVPIGTKSTVLLPSDDFQAVGKLLKNTKLTSLDFESVIDNTGPRDFLFVDPPYTVRHNLNGFIKYNEKLFSWSDQIRLRDSVFRASARGVKILMSNADHQSIRDLYADCSSMTIATRRSVMAAQSENRKITTELLINI